MRAAAFLILVGTASTRGEDLEYFEKKYGTELSGIKPIEAYSDPDAYYTAIARQLGIFDLALKAASQKYGWKKGGGKVQSAKLTRAEGGPWELMVVQVEVNPETKRPDASTMHTLEIRYVFIDDDGMVTFPMPPVDNKDADDKSEEKEPEQEGGAPQ